jgi:hypothetical protein
MDTTPCAIKNILKKLRNRAATLEIKSKAKAEEVIRAGAMYNIGASVRTVAKTMKISVGKAAKLRCVHLKRLRTDLL